MKKLRVPALVLVFIFLLQTFAAFATDIEYPPDMNPFLINDGMGTQMYRDRTGKKIYSSIGYGAFRDALAALPKLPVAKTPVQWELKAPAEKSMVAVMLVDSSDFYAKHRYELRPNELKYDGTTYALTDKQYEALKKAIDADSEHEWPYPQWLVWMNPERVTSMEFTNSTGKIYNVKSENVMIAAMEQRFVSVSSFKVEKYDPKAFDIKKLEGRLQTVMNFNSGVVYTLVMHEKSLYLESSDQSYGCKYEMDNDVAVSNYKRWMKIAATEIFPPATGKPVIYLYPEKTQDVSVKLDFKGKIRYTYPAYNGGWNVTASPDGKLVNKADLSEHYYLFWDGDAYFNGWDFSSGFCVKGSEIENFFKDKLPKLGLTPKEYNDFITYWTPLLAPNEYNLITFATEQYENIAPLAVTPAPDTVLRVHMVYKPVSAPAAIPEQKLPEAPERKGFTVVEWGATRAR